MEKPLHLVPDRSLIFAPPALLANRGDLTSEEIKNFIQSAAPRGDFARSSGIDWSLAREDYSRLLVENGFGDFVEPFSPLDFAPSPPSLAPDVKEGSRFILFGAQWMNIQSFCASAMTLPIVGNEWSATYGVQTASLKKEVDLVAADLKTLRFLGSQFGDPALLKESVFDLDSTENPPQELYSHIIWLAAKIQRTAGTFAFGMHEVQKKLDPSLVPDSNRRLQFLQWLFVAPNGLNGMARQMSQEARVLLNKLLAFDRDLAGTAAQLKEHVFGRNSLLAQGNAMLGSTSADVTLLQSQMNSAYDRWRDLTIAASTTSGLLLVLSFGFLFPLAVGVGGGLGAAAAVARSNYEKLRVKLAYCEAEKSKKVRLVTDLQGLDAKVGFLVQDIAHFRENLEKVEGFWLNASTNLSGVFRDYDPGLLLNLHWMLGAFKILEARNAWIEIGMNAGNFVGQSLASYRKDVSFGASIPQR